MIKRGLIALLLLLPIGFLVWSGLYQRSEITFERASPEGQDLTRQQIDHNLLALVSQARTNQSPATNNQPPITNYQSPVTSADSLAAKTSYANEWRRIIAVYAQANRINLAKVLLHYIDTRQNADLNLLKQSLESHQVTIRALQKLPTPPSAASYQLNLVNNLAGLAQTIYNMGAVETAPVAALQSARDYLGHYLLTLQAFAAMNQYFSDQKIKFDPNEPAPNITIDF